MTRTRQDTAGADWCGQQLGLAIVDDGAVGGSPDEDAEAALALGLAGADADEVMADWAGEGADDCTAQTGFMLTLGNGGT